MSEAAVTFHLLIAMVALLLGLNIFKHRVLPIALPIGLTAFVLAIICLLQAVLAFWPDMGQWNRQLITDIDVTLLSFIIPLWVWVLLEYHYEKKISLTNKWLVLVLIHPSIQIILSIIDIYHNGFVSKESVTAIITFRERLGDYLPVRLVYSKSMLLMLTVVTPYLMIKKQQHSVLDLVKVVVLTLLPYGSFLLYDQGVLHIRLFEMFLAILIFWIIQQYRLLNVMPIALRGVVDKVDSGILVSNKKSKLLFVNDFASKLLDLNLPSAALKQRKHEIPETIKKHFDLSSSDKQEAQIELQGKCNGHYYLDAVLRPIFHPKTKKQMGATISLHDVTKRKNTELQLQSFDRQKSEFFAGISHEFRTPLTLSLGNLDDVIAEADSIKPAELKSALAHVKNNNQRLLTLVNQLLELSRLEAGSMLIQPVLLSLDSYLPPLIANFESQASKQHCQIHLHFNHATAQQSSIYFDRNAFDKVILNLLSNALKSMPHGGDLTIELESITDEDLELRVKDTGCGIPADALDKVFEMFYSHQRDNPAWPQGAGVGLSLVKQLLSEHGADIMVDSMEGKGTTFTLRLRKGYAHFPQDVLIDHHRQLADSANRHTFEIVQPSKILIDNANVLAEHQREMQDQQSEKLVLLVEDNPEMRAYIRKHLAMHFRLIEAADGEEGLELALQSTPDLVLSDVMMPKMNGYELCQQLKSHQQTSHIPILLLTAKSSQTEKLEGLELGADDYLSKPFDVQELTLRMLNLIKSRQLIQELYQSKGLQKVICNPELPKRETTFLDTLQSYVEDNISNADIQVSHMADAVFMSERSLNRKLKALTGETPKKMLMVIRLEYAAKLLTNTDESITEVGYRSGFGDASHFTRSFKAQYKVTPSQYRNNELLDS